MANNNKKKLLFTTPRGTAMYPWLNRARHTVSYQRAVQSKSADVPKNEAKELMEDVRDAANDAFGDKAKNANMPWKVDEDTGEIFT